MTRPQSFALFADVMGVQQQLTATPSSAAAIRCAESLARFRADLAAVVSADLPAALPANVPVPHFVAEFSDSAYIASPSFPSVAVAGVLLMRRAVKHKYPLRGGIGFGSFAHDMSGVRTLNDGSVWTTAAFHGVSIVTAYQAERTPAMGLRIFVHRTVIEHAPDGGLWPFLVKLQPEDENDISSHELRIWRHVEVSRASVHIRTMRDAQELTSRAWGHYDATFRTYRRFGLVQDELPVVPPALWLFSSAEDQ